METITRKLPEKCQTVMRVTHAPLYHSARCIFSWTVLPGTEGREGVKNAWRTRPAAQHQDFRNRLLSCYRSLLFLPRSVRDTFLPCEIHTSSTSIRRGRGEEGDDERARVGRLTEIVPSWTLSPSIYSSLVVDFVRFIEACPRIFQREHCHDPGLMRGAATRIHPGGEILIW